MAVPLQVEARPDGAHAQVVRTGCGGHRVHPVPGQGAHEQVALVALQLPAHEVGSGLVAEQLVHASVGERGQRARTEPRELTLDDIEVNQCVGQVDVQRAAGNRRQRGQLVEQLAHRAGIGVVAAVCRGQRQAALGGALRAQAAAPGRGLHAVWPQAELHVPIRQE